MSTYVNPGPAITTGSNDQFVSGNGVVVGLNADTTVGFYGDTGIVKATITGARDDGTALLSLLTALADMGLIVDATTAT